jgi:hypothetical protein
VTHSGVFFTIIADPGFDKPADLSGLAERANDLAVRERAGWSTREAAASCTLQSAAGLKTLQQTQQPPLAHRPCARCHRHRPGRRPTNVRTPAVHLSDITVRASGEDYVC